MAKVSGINFGRGRRRCVVQEPKHCGPAKLVLRLCQSFKEQLTTVQASAIGMIVAEVNESVLHCANRRCYGCTGWLHIVGESNHISRCSSSFVVWRELCVIGTNEKMLALSVIIDRITPEFHVLTEMPFASKIDSLEFIGIR